VTRGFHHAQYIATARSSAPGESLANHDPELTLTKGSKYRVESLESREKTIVSHGEFLGFIPTPAGTHGLHFGDSLELEFHDGRVDAETRSVTPGTPIGHRPTGRLPPEVGPAVMCRDLED